MWQGKDFPLELCWIKFGGERKKMGENVTPPTRHPVSSKGVIFFPVYYKLINFKLVHLYNVKHLTCTILCSSGLQNIYKLHM